MKAPTLGQTTLKTRTLASCGCCGGRIVVTAAGIVSRVCRCEDRERCLKCGRCGVHHACIGGGV